VPVPAADDTAAPEEIPEEEGVEVVEAADEDDGVPQQYSNRNQAQDDFGQSDLADEYF
jgi:hypothetical protein